MRAGSLSFFSIAILSTFWGSPAYSMWWYPQTHQECVTGYVAKAKTQAAADLFSRACKDLFKERSIDEFILEKFRNEAGLNYDQEPSRDLSYEIYRKLYSKDKQTVEDLLKILQKGPKMNDSDMAKLLNAQQTADQFKYFLEDSELKYHEERKKEITDAKCVLSISGLVETQTDIGASALLQESGCWKN